MKKFLGGLLILLTLPGLFFLLFTLAADRTLANPVYVKENLKEQQTFEKIYNQMPEIVQAVNANMEEGGTQSVFSKPLTDVEVRRASQKVTSPEEIETLSNAFFDSFITWLMGKSEVLEPVSIKSLKIKIDIEMKEVFRQRYESLPLCTRKQLMNGEVTATCRASGYSFDAMIQLLEEESGQKFSFTAILPNEFSLQEMASGNAQSRQQYELLLAARSSLELTGWVLIVFGIIIVLTLLLGSRLIASSWEKTLPVFGIVLVLISGLGFLISCIIPQRLIAVTNAELGRMDSLPNLRDTLFIPLSNHFINDYFSEFNKYLFAIIILSLVLFLTYVLFFLYEKHVTSRPGWSLKSK